MSESKAYEGWAIVELMGHRKLAGWVGEAVQYGVPMLRIDVPAADGDGDVATQFYGGGAIYAVTPCTEDVARRTAANMQHAVRPVTKWELRPALPAAPAVTVTGGFRPGDDFENFDDYPDNEREVDDVPY